MGRLHQKAKLENTTDTRLAVGEFKLDHEVSKWAFQGMKVIPKTEANLLWETLKK